MDKTTDLSRLSRVRVLAAGDIMLDRYEYGSVERISPEAPVPVFRPLRRKDMLGGVGNVAANLVAMGCRVDLVSRVGRDSAGKAVAKMAASAGIDANLVYQDDACTIVKTRLVAGNNHLLRIDDETPGEMDGETARKAAEACLAVLDKVDVVLLSDYAKGMLSKKFCKTVIDASRKRGLKVVVDPKGADYSKYKGAFLVKPNLKELSLATGRTFDSAKAGFLDDVASTARELARKIGANGLLVTLSEHGMLYAPASSRGKPLHLPTKAKEVFDVSGAGDTALAAIGAATGAGLGMHEAMQIANAASCVVVSKLGTATANLEEIAAVLAEKPADPADRKIVPAESIAKIAEKYRRQGKTVGFTNGCFDCCHLGHLSSLQEAKSLCDVLVVGVNSDEWIKRHKGPGRPIQDEKTRTSLLAALECVDHVVVFGDETALPLVKLVRPDIIAKEGYAIENWPEGRFVRKAGGKAVVLKRVAGYSTTAIADKMKAER